MIPTILLLNLCLTSLKSVVSKACMISRNTNSHSSLSSVIISTSFAFYGLILCDFVLTFDIVLFILEFILSARFTQAKQTYHYYLLKSLKFSLTCN